MAYGKTSFKRMRASVKRGKGIGGGLPGFLASLKKQGKTGAKKELTPTTATPVRDMALPRAKRGFHFG